MMVSVRNLVRPFLVVALFSAFSASALGEDPLAEARRLLADKQYREAIAEARKHVGDRAAGPGALHLQGEAHYYLGEYEASRRAYLLTRERASGNPALQASARRNASMACAALGIRARDEGRVDEARAHLEEAVRIDPDYGHALFTLGGVLTGLRRYERAKGVLRRFLAGEGGGQADRARAWTWLGLMAMDEGRLGRARKHFQEALEEDRSFGEAEASLEQVTRMIEGVEKTSAVEHRLLGALAVVLLVYVGGGAALFRFLERRERL